MIDMNRAGDVGQFVVTSKARQDSLVIKYPEFHRPWGWYEIQFKRIMVRLSSILTRQSCYNSAEYWVTMHRMEDPGKPTMYLIEVHTGENLGEDDIVLYEEVYNGISFHAVSITPFSPTSFGLPENAAATVGGVVRSRAEIVGIGWQSELRDPVSRTGVTDK